MVSKQAYAYVKPGERSAGNETSRQLEVSCFGPLADLVAFDKFDRCALKELHHESTPGSWASVFSSGINRITSTTLDCA